MSKERIICTHGHKWFLCDDCRVLPVERVPFRQVIRCVGDELETSGLDGCSFNQALTDSHGDPMWLDQDEACSDFILNTVENSGDGQQTAWRLWQRRSCRVPSCRSPMVMTTFHLGLGGSSKTCAGRRELPLCWGHQDGGVPRARDRASYSMRVPIFDFNRCVVGLPDADPFGMGASDSMERYLR